jgi:hypothetical protein
MSSLCEWIRGARAVGVNGNVWIKQWRSYRDRSSWNCRKKEES